MGSEQGVEQAVEERFAQRPALKERSVAKWAHVFSFNHSAGVRAGMGEQRKSGLLRVMMQLAAAGGTGPSKGNVEKHVGVDQ